jgi:excinuclease ABC subunit C
MKAYGDLPAIAAADPEEMAERCKLSSAAAKAVRAAALLALEDQPVTRRRLLRGTGEYPPTASAAFLAAKAAAPDLPEE